MKEKDCNDLCKFTVAVNSENCSVVTAVQLLFVRCSPASEVCHLTLYDTECDHIGQSYTTLAMHVNTIETEQLCTKVLI